MSQSVRYRQGVNLFGQPLGRREFLKGAGAVVASTLVAAPGRAMQAESLSADRLIVGKDRRLLVHTAAPAVFETPAELLAADHITPAPLLFVRNNQQPPDAATMKPLPAAGWKIELAGLIERPLTLDARGLAELEQVDVEMVLQCSGNSRMLFAAAAMTTGMQWGRGGMGNVRFGGVRLQKVLEHYGVKIKPQARYLTAEGRDEPRPGEQDFEHSIPLDDAVETSLVALRLNGEPLPAIHGGPARLVTPGYYGTMHVKWLSRLAFETKESSHTSQIPNYRTPREPIKPGEAFAFTFDNSEPNWRMKIKCVVLAPVAGALLTAGGTRVSGVAFNDGRARVESVLLSTDEGRAWQRAELGVPKSPYAWYRWHSRVKLPAGKQQIWARAVDALGRTQPLDGAIHWNPQGYTWSGVEKIAVEVASS
jgi:DMSO/TMAO reductase YedYZ molybdopterin-dependent catalytic subunit